MQERGREVLAPDHDGVGGRSQQDQVHGQPAPAGDPVAQGERHSAGGQVGQDEPCHQKVTAGTLGPHRWRDTARRVDGRPPSVSRRRTHPARALGPYGQTREA
jgi:hypothetical protein